MPIYVFECAAGHREEHLCRQDGSDAPATCAYLDEVASSKASEGVYTACGKPLRRAPAAPGAFPGAASWRQR